jgi:hypothetical protein
LEPEEEHYNEPVEKQRKDEKGKKIAENSMRHVTTETKKIILNSKDLPNSSLKRGHLTILEDNLENVEIKKEFDLCWKMFNRQHMLVIDGKYKGFEKYY